MHDILLLVFVTLLILVIVFSGDDNGSIPR